MRPSMVPGCAVLVLQLMTRAEAASLSVNASDAGPPISPGLFGHNLEFTRHDLFAGLSAQLVANRQFVIPPNNTKWPYAWDTPGSFPARWAPIGNPSVERPGFAGPTSSAIKCEAAGSSCGISQGTVGEGFNSGKGGGSSIPLQAGGTYTARITARAVAAAPLTLSYRAVGEPTFHEAAGSDGYLLVSSPESFDKGKMCDDRTRITDLPCGNCGPAWGDLGKCKQLCSARDDCTHITFFEDEGCRAYTSCDDPIPVPYETQAFIYKKDMSAPFGYMCDDSERIQLPCRDCGPHWNNLAACKSLCSSISECTNITYFDNQGCRAYRGCDVLVSTPSSYSCRSQIFGRTSGNISESLSLSFALPADGEWHTLEMNGTAVQSSEGATLSLQSSDQGIFWIGAVSLMPADNFLGMRRDVIAKLKEIGFHGPLRFPGGCFAPFYNWRESLLPADARPPMLTPPDYCAAVSGGVNAYTDGAVENGLSTDEFIALCDELGMEPEITLALQFATEAELQDAKDWSEYCNGGVDTRMGKLRGSRGHPEPFNVQLWTLGNEMNLQSRYHNYPNDTSHVGTPSGEEYASIVSSAARAIASNPPSKGALQMFFIGDGNSDWDGPTIAALPHDFTYYVSFHDGYYSQGSLSKPADFTAAAKMGGHQLLQGMRGLRSKIDAHAEAAGFNRTIAISADEWGLGEPWSVNGFGSVHALYGAALMGSVLRNAASLSVAFTNYFEVINEGGITVHPFSAELTAVGEALSLYSRHQNCGQISVDPVQPEGGDLDAIASLCGGTRLQLTVANLNAESSHDLALSFGDEASFVSAELLVARMPLTSLSGFNRTELELPMEGGQCSLRLPPFAIGHVTVQLPNQVVPSMVLSV